MGFAMRVQLQLQLKLPSKHDQFSGKLKTDSAVILTT